MPVLTCRSVRDSMGKPGTSQALIRSSSCLLHTGNAAFRPNFSAYEALRICKSDIQNGICALKKKEVKLRTCDPRYTSHLEPQTRYPSNAVQGLGHNLPFDCKWPSDLSGVHVSAIDVDDDAWRGRGPFVAVVFLPNLRITRCDLKDLRYRTTTCAKSREMGNTPISHD